MRFLLLFLGFNLLWIPGSIAQTISQTEMLQRPEYHSISVHMMFADSVEWRCEWGLKSKQYTDVSNWTLALPQSGSVLTLNNLLNDTLYYYHVQYRKPASINVINRNEHTFHTARMLNRSFTFTVQADPHLDVQSDTAVYRNCLTNQLNDKPDFMIDLGDFIMTDKLKNKSGVLTRDTIVQRFHLLRSWYSNITHSVPLFIALGNHEAESGWNLNGTSENIAVWNTLERKRFFANPQPDAFYSGDTSSPAFTGPRQSYYAWTWANVLCIVLDPYWNTNVKPDSLNGWRWTLGKAQYDWLKKTLENSNADFKFVFAHQIVGGDPSGRGGVEYADKYEWGGNNLDASRGFENNRPGWSKPIKDLLTDHRVTIFFHGHDHFFGKQIKNCLVYQETPQPSHPNFNSVQYAYDYGYKEGLILPNSGHIRVKVSPDGILTEYVRAYKTSDETPQRHNGDVSAFYFIGKKNCYDSLSTGIPMIYNETYENEFPYPNPFNTSTRIRFQVKNKTKINIQIMNINGEIVQEPIQLNECMPGQFFFDWDGTDIHANPLPDGVYFSVIKINDQMVQKNKIQLSR